MKHLNYNELSAFLEIALEPIVGDKKKAVESQRQIEEVTEKLIEKMGIEQFTASLQSVLSSTAGLSTISKKD